MILNMRLLCVAGLLLNVVQLYATGSSNKFDMAQSALQVQDYALAYQLYQQALSSASEEEITGGYYFNAALAAQKSKNYEIAIEYYDQAILMEANLQASRLGKYESLIALGRVDEVILFDAENEGKWRYKAGVFAYSQEEFELAATQFALAIRGEYQEENAIIYQYNSLIKAGRTIEADDLITNQVENYPNSKLHIVMANILLHDAILAYQEGILELSHLNGQAEDPILTVKAHSAIVRTAKVKFQQAQIVGEESLKYDSSNEQVHSLIEACKSQLLK
ncbi:MAG: hypothetical protein ACK5IJ_02500 [Mangrovibacterium sp.]